MTDNDIPPEFKNGVLYKRDINGKIIEEYHKGDKFGKGGFAACYKVYSKENKKVFLAKELAYNENATKEAEIHSLLKHDNIVKFYDKIKEEKGNESKLYLILEFCENRDLSELVKKKARLTEIEVQYYIRNLIEALKYLHEKTNIVHCDLKPGNIFLTDKLEVKLGDFGLAKKITSDNTPSNNGGTIYYMAPESLKNNKCSYKVDIWAIGIIIYNLLTGKFPFHGDNQEKTKEKIISGNLDFPPDIVISKLMKDLIRQILKKDPKERPTLNQILQHKFFTIGRGIPKLLPKSFINKVPSIGYIKNFIVDVDESGIINIEPPRINLNEIKLDEDKNYQNDNNFKNKMDENIYVRELFLNEKYINKYGLAYILSNDFYGVCFRDSTKIVCSPKTNMCKYFKNAEEKIFNINNYEKIISEEKNEKEKEKADLDKKVKLLKFYMEHETKNNSSNNSDKTSPKNINSNEIDSDISGQKQTYVKHYYIYENSPIVLRLNNKNIQVYFNSNESILLSKENNEVTFIKKDKSELKSNVFQFDNAMETQSIEIVKKLQYVKSLLAKIVNDDSYLP